MFTKQPLNATTLSKRLEKSNFYNRKLTPELASNAILAAKKLNAHKSADVPTRLASFIDKSDHLNQMLNNKQIQQLTPYIWKTLIADPKPKTLSLLGLLEKFEGDKNNLYGALPGFVRCALSQNEFVEAFAYLNYTKPQNNRLICGIGLAGVAVGIGLGGCFMVSYPFGILLGASWLGFVYALLKPPQYPRVEFNSKVPFYYKLQNTNQIKLANQIVSAFEELASVNVANYHHQPKDFSLKLEQQVDIELYKYRMKRRPFQESQLFLDYWSTSHRRWERVEWTEPDQDPARHS